MDCTPQSDRKEAGATRIQKSPDSINRGGRRKGKASAAFFSGHSAPFESGLERGGLGLT
ncbi:hypothetical protein [Azospirillum argentinense]|uniref:Uncharacterized protein n=1 Tax=Azospirillum argentinense TaxID=2970906 RepID=A0A5B0KYI0_9PROT|nr:hypothetical protein FH063_004606 [Azospirillum argentinense]